MRLPHLAVLALVATATAACQTRTEFAEAIRLESLAEAPGGPLADARVGDFMLRNDQIRVVIEQGGQSRTPLDVGGTIIDVDLNRPEAEFRGGHGLDQLGQIAPVVNLYVAQASGGDSVRITGSIRGAQITATGEGGPIQRLIEAVGVLLYRQFIGVGELHSRFRIYTEYEVRPGERLLHTRTTVGYDVPFCRPEPGDGCNPECDDILYDADCVCPGVPARCEPGVSVLEASPLPDRPVGGLLALLLGDLPLPPGSGRCQVDDDCPAGERCTDLTTMLGGEARVCRAPDERDAGIFMGDMLFFGGHLGTFLPGSGPDIDSDFRRLFDRGGDTLLTPIELDEVFAVGDRISYGYAPKAGKILVPVFGGPFSFGATAGASCRNDQPGCLSKKLVRFERILGVGDGDPATAREPLLAARGEPVGEVRGHVIRAGTGEPVAGAEVYAFLDPRDLPCEGECRTRCPLDGVDDAAVAAWSLDELMRHNRCRTRGGPFLEGRAGVDTMARTDVGTDRVRDGDYRLPTRPGRYVVLALDGNRARSALVPVTVEAGRATHVGFQLAQHGRLEYAVFDEAGRPTAGRLTVGSCFPGTPCASDAECGGDTRCYEGACACARTRFRPLEVGGARLADGALAFHQTADGEGGIDLPPGTYEILISRGPHHTLHRETVTIESGVVTRALARLRRVVDTTGWTAADFHVHAEPSFDSNLPLADRVTSFLAEDMDFLSSSDHDALTSYDALLQELGATDQLASMVGSEVTTMELGHFIGFPLRYVDHVDGVPDPRHGAPEWRGRPPQEIFDSIRAAGDPDGPTPLVVVPHPGSYFDPYRIDLFTLEPSDSLITFFNDMAHPSLFSGDFDAMELANSKSFDQVRRPTIDELRFYSSGLDSVIARFRAGELDDAGYHKEVYLLSTEMTKRILQRTAAEQEAATTGTGTDLPCLCGSDGDCAAGLVCDHGSMTCKANPTDPPGTGRVPPAGPCRAFRGYVDDWMTMLNRGVVRTGIGGSDVHAIYGFEAGLPRTMLHTGATTPPYLGASEILEAIKAGRSIVTNGPMIHFTIDDRRIGDTVVPEGQEVRLHLRVEKAPWYDVDRIEIYRNGKLIHWITGCNTRRGGDDPEPHGHACLPVPSDGVVVFEETITDQPDGDAWYAVAAMGLDGRTLAPVYGSAVQARLGTLELAQRLYDLVPILTALRTPRFPSLYPTFPYGITNPIFVDVAGDGWTAPLPSPSWCIPGRDC